MKRVLVRNAREAEADEIAVEVTVVAVEVTRARPIGPRLNKFSWIQQPFWIQGIFDLAMQGT
ncbi:MAG: hypothetical protein JWM16_5063 [Verrucomicrobiales bacterium]|nr:hypothetical protein [Verrucomicrobiales bacterium]